MKNIHDTIRAQELYIGLQSDEFQEDLNFGLVNIVYEWAINKVNTRFILSIFLSFSFSLLQILWNLQRFKKGL